MSDDWHSAYQSERQAHAETKAKLEALEDAIENYVRFTYTENSRQIILDACNNARQRKLASDL